MWRRAVGFVLIIGLGCGDAGSDDTAGDSDSPSSGGRIELGAGGQTSGAGGSGANAGGSATTSGGTSASAGGAPASGGSDGGSLSSGGSAEGPTGGASTGGVPSGSGGDATGGMPAVVGGTFVPDPSWSCGMPEGLVDPELGELVFSVTLEIGAVRDVGATQYGHRRFTDIKGGTTEGGDLSASFLEGGLDFELTLENGTIELEQVAMLQADDGGYIYLRSCGIAPSGSDVVRFVPDFEAANNSASAWLNTGTFVGTRTLDTAQNQMELAIYDVSMVPTDGAEVVWQDPSGVAQQPWDCLELSGTKGAEVLTETVGIGSSLSVGASKRGTRNVIPITGGSVSGRFTGSVVPAGADFQLLGGTATLDARYVLESNDDEFVLVRNCGPFGGMVPLFEARDDGPYAFLNENRFLSSDPGSAAGGVSITFYEIQ